MAQPVSSPRWPGVSPLALGVAGLGAVLLLAAVGLWLRYGTAVFFEMIAAGISACF
jgi:hypothetical protein